MKHALVVFLAILPCFATAANFDTIDSLDQPAFRLLAEDLGAAFSYRTVQGAEPFGTLGYDFSMGANNIRFSNAGVWRSAGNNSGSGLTLVRVDATKGLTDRFDVGAYIATATNSGLRIHGVQGRYALLEGGVGKPAVGVRAAATRIGGVDRLDYDTRSLDLTASQRFGAWTPFVGVGRLWVDARPDANTGLLAESFTSTRSFAGFRFTSMVLQLGLQFEQTADATGYSVNVGFYF